MNKKINLIIGSILIITNITLMILTYNFRLSLQAERLISTTAMISVNKLKISSNAFYKNAFNQYLIEMKSDFSKLKLYDKDGKLVEKEKLYDGTDTLLFFRFFEYSCNDCINKYLANLNKPSTIQKHKVILIVNSSNIKKTYKEYENFGFQIYFTNDKLNSIEQADSPYLLTIGKSLKIISVFIPDDENIEKTSDYINIYF